MTRIPKLITVCTTCKRENVGVVIDWSDGDVLNKLNPRYRKSRHSVEYQKDRRSPICAGSREVVHENLVFENEEGVRGRVSAAKGG